MTYASLGITFSRKNCVTSGFRREVDKNCALLGHYAASSGNFLQTFWDNLSVPFSLSQNVSKELPLLAA